MGSFLTVFLTGTGVLTTVLVVVVSFLTAGFVGFVVVEALLVGGGGGRDTAVVLRFFTPGSPLASRSALQ